MIYSDQIGTNISIILSRWLLSINKWSTKSDEGKKRRDANMNCAIGNCYLSLLLVGPSIGWLFTGCSGRSSAKRITKIVPLTRIYVISIHPIRMMDVEKCKHSTRTWHTVMDRKWDVWIMGHRDDGKKNHVKAQSNNRWHYSNAFRSNRTRRCKLINRNHCTHNCAGPVCARWFGNANGDSATKKKKKEKTSRYHCKHIQFSLLLFFASFVILHERRTSSKQCTKIHKA